MMTDPGGQDPVEDVLVMILIILASLNFVVTLGSVIVAWSAFARARMNLARYALLAPAVNIAVYIVVFFLLGLRAANRSFW
jgi:uncharacterized membrane protein YozB (DUF420 family)